MHNEMQLPLLGWSSRVGSSKVSPRDAPSLSPLTPPVRAAAVGCLLRRMYASVPSVSTSDHKPFVAAFDLLPSVPVDFTDSDNAPRGELPKPPGFSESSSHDQDHAVAKRGLVDQTQLKLKKAKELSWSPGKNFMMTAFMLVRL